MQQAYRKLFREGNAFSVEAYLQETLVGGVYGVTINGLIAGESMFHKTNDASKVCLLTLLSLLQAEEILWMDVQMTTPATRIFSPNEISREAYLKLLEEQLQKDQPSSLLGRRRVGTAIEIFDQKIRPMLLRTNAVGRCRL